MLTHFDPIFSDFYQTLMKGAFRVNEAQGLSLDDLYDGQLNENSIFDKNMKREIANKNGEKP